LAYLSRGARTFFALHQFNSFATTPIKKWQT